RLAERTISGRNQTIVHGDAHIWNAMLPRSGGDDVRFIDFDAWHVGLPTADLANMMAMQWYPEWRRGAESKQLDHYHETLLTQGVRGYDRAALAEDYRRSVLWNLTAPAWQEGYGVPPVIWWNNLQRVLLAVDDLGCAALLE